MGKRKSSRSKKVTIDTYNEVLTPDDRVKIKSLFKGIWVLIVLILMFSLAIKKVFTATDNGIQWTGWLILAGGFALIIGLGIWISPWVEKITGMSEDRAITVIVVILVGITVGAAYLLWGYIEPFFMPSP